MTHDSFIKAFKDMLDEPEYIFYALLLYSNDAEKYKNTEMMKMLVIDENEVKEYYINQLGLQVDFDDVDDLSRIRTWVQNELKECIQNNLDIYNSIFKGTDWFDDPYIANYVYLNKKIFSNDLVDFSITTGSGRSKGKFSIEIKLKITGKIDEDSQH